ncbi:hypothetical protein EK21DRAFT_68719 [Setomelanomma holmii]|uniref:Uncharacterized protein n=1 Tax=Setomelanomma holmii TaxID=210430 RepID=A0A9P4H8I2_9PLEO|nr:hypothetical protein EK21DRAFT_68719 [Setomelanomma holmii]
MVSPLPSDPETPVAQRNGTLGKTKAANGQNNMNGPDFAKAIGINKPANVKDKIKRWQQEVEPDAAGAEKAGASAESFPKPAPSPKPQTTPKAKALDDKPNWTPTHTPRKSTNVSPERSTSPKKPPVTHNKLDEEVLVATAPKKRVVSDSRWRNKQSPPKDTGRPAPKTIPNAWVRPSKIVKKDKEGIDEDKPASPPKVEHKTPAPLTPPLNALVSYVGKSTGQKKGTIKQRRPSKPGSQENERPVSHGSGSSAEVKSEEIAAGPTSPKLQNDPKEIIKVRRRPRARTSPRGSLSADEGAALRHTARPARKSDTSLVDDSANIVTVEYDEESKVTSPRDSEIRERRRRRRPRSQGNVSADDSPGAPITTGRRRHRRSSPGTSDQGLASPPPEPVAPDTTPNKVFGTRLEAWLNTTPDPFVEKKSRHRRRSEESVSTLELQSKAGASDVTASTESKDEQPEETLPRSGGSGSGSKRRRRRRSREMKIDTKITDEPASSLSDDAHEVPTPEKDAEVSLTPTPTLKRRGAKRSQHSPTKSRSISSPLRETTSVDDESSHVTRDSEVASTAPSSSVESSALEIESFALRPRPLAVQRAFPSTGKRLSTIVSVESFATRTQEAPASTVTGSEISTISEETNTATEVPASNVGSFFNPETSTIVSRRSTRRKSRLASHADLMSVLSMPKAAGTKSIVSARSIRTNRSRLATATIGDIMKELATDEAKYMRELRTLVDGVIPVLLSCVLSKSDSAVAAGLFSRSAHTDSTSVTKPIVEMGECLERLKTLHKRVPKDDPDAFVSWAQSAQRVYAGYIAAWRLGFQDVVISLAPADDDPFKPSKVVDGPDDGAPWDEGMPRNAEGYVINGDGERVDVAYMLKRPLVRLKYLAKSLKGVSYVKPSERAEKISIMFQDLVTAARKRSNDEHARLEDEAAAAIDPTRARDPRSLAPLAGVRVDPNRCVRARDHFDLHLYHSTGQEVSCRVEILIRDDAPGFGSNGDLLFCEVDPTGRWLLLPPVQLSRVSARNGDLKGEIIVMIRGVQADGSEWSEVMSLVTDDEQAGFEWVQMLGLNPIPPQLSEIRQSQNSLPQPGGSHASSSLLSAMTASTIPQKSRTPSPHEIEIPIGEQHTEVSKVWRYDTPEKRAQSGAASPITPPSGEKIPFANTHEAIQYQNDPDRTPRSLDDAARMAGADSPTGLKRTRAKRLSKNVAASPSASRPSRQITLDDPTGAKDDAKPAEEEVKPRRKLTKRQRPKSLPSASSEISQSSKAFSVWMPSSDVDFSGESDESDHSSEGPAPSPPDPPPTSPQRPQAHRRVSSSSSSSEEETVSEEDVDEEDKASLTSDSSEDELDDDVPMPLMPIGYIGPRGYSSRPPSGGRDATRPSRDKVEIEDTKKFPKVSPPSSIYTLPNGTITPSQSASNTPYRAVPQSSGKAVKAVASIFAWSDAGRWDSLHPDECSIVVTPGKIEVFEISAMHSKPFVADGDEIIQPEGRAPLIAVELTPLVPLRKSTAIDISIRSPPTADSRIRTGNNIMLRSRNPAECAQLYAMINQSRINNPTYLALQNARGPYGQTSWAEAMDRQNAARTNGGSSSGWLGGTLGRRSSYRKSSTRAASISAATDSSVGTMNTALKSALGRFSWGKNGVFSVRNSTLGSRSTGSSFDAGSSGGSGSSTPNGDGRAPGAPAGITNTKCRLYERETLKKWRDMGSARLTIMLPSPNPSAPSSPSPNTRQRAHGQRDPTQERRIVITGKTKGEVLLDVTLSESCFERVARSGIAVSVWEDVVGDDGQIGRVGKTGGVSGARARVFMVQMKSERECAYCYGLLGKLRY